MAKTTKLTLSKWDTLHSNGPFPLKFLYKTKLEATNSMPSNIDRYNDAAQEIQRLITETKNQNQGFRAYGSAWSMSKIAHQKDRMHYNAHMNTYFSFMDQDLHAMSSYDASNLFLFQCGNNIKEISEKLAGHGKSLKASGASNGQTIAGCISTGVHGSAINVGSVQDYVVGLNLIIGPNPGDIVYLERHTKPVLNNVFVQKLRSRVIRNDGLFNAALVGLGSFGFIHGVVIEAQNLFLLKRYVRKIDKNIALQLAETQDFKNSSFKIQGETDSNGKGNIPYHYKIFINQYKDDGKYVVECMYKKPFRQSYPDPFPVIKTSVYRDLINLAVKIGSHFPNTIPLFIQVLENSILPDVNEEATGTLAEIFWDAPYQGPAFACSFGVDHKDSRKAMEVLTKLSVDEGPVPGIFAMRFIKKSNATLSFARFPITCMIEIDGVLWNETNNLMSLKTFSKRMIEVLQSNNIPFTIHWGKNADWKFPGLTDHMYGADAKTWRMYRCALLSDDMQKLFANEFLKNTKLDKKETNIPSNLIDSLL
ncbi:FAD-binding protein [Flagellimonas sp. HMM57]|uniref:FAD-binding protein n=1 Tax=unclassified Flagellimonas TaxID=2644544 RepID=UPI0013D7BD13|nr:MULTISPECIES: FAD-binding protein [unclassified Flagellimonas]UII77585.1 FAD-binding protein [Flagellimonas sp. HMM57]